MEWDYDATDLAAKIFFGAVAALTIIAFLRLLRSRRRADCWWCVNGSKRVTMYGDKYIHLGAPGKVHPCTRKS